jgi:hypothetical protein
VDGAAGVGTAGWFSCDRRWCWRFLPFGVGVDGRHDPFDRAVTAGVVPVIQEHLAGGFQALLIPFSQGLQDVLAVQIRLCFDRVPVNNRGCFIECVRGPA